MQTTLSALLADGGPVILDGATGTMLFEMGLQHGDSPELWNVEQPDKLRSLHQQYVDAGAQVILTNTFGCNRLRLALHKLQDRVEELNAAAAQTARAVADAAARSVVVAGDMGPTGSILVPYGDMEFDEAVSVFEQQARALIAAGVDLIWVETMSDLEEVRAAVEAVRRVDVNFPIVLTMTFDTNGRTMMGVKPEQAVEALVAYNPVAIGGNCGNGTDEIETVIETMRAANADVPLVTKSNAGIPTLQGTVAVYDATPDDMADHARTVHELGAQIIGGCCGTTPDHIRAIANALKQQVS